MRHAGKKFFDEGPEASFSLVLRVQLPFELGQLLGGTELGVHSEGDYYAPSNDASTLLRENPPFPGHSGSTELTDARRGSDLGGLEAELVAGGVTEQNLTRRADVDSRGRLVDAIGDIADVQRDFDVVANMLG